jgi:alkanesulfonate monooxygenase SsuD/methylene tetrahydromethanopterin reductase-like flavin-dependent oxidoreductase (luciferase family)/putative sterol carrier protein
MKFGLFYEHQMARPWAEGQEHQLFKDALDQIELADRLGFEYVWEVEHHFLEEYSHSSAPEVFLAAASQRTSNIRLGHGIVNLMPQVNHPARVAERIATLDLISDGRVEFGTGESSSQAELGAFGVDRERKRGLWSESLGEIARMFAESPYAGHDGPAFSMPPREVLPKPLQKPHPPMWVACSRRDTIITAAENGVGALSFSFVEPEQAKEWVDEYYGIIESERCKPIGFSVNPNFAVVLPMMCHEDESVAMERALDGANFFGYSLAHYYVFGEHEPGKTNIAEQFDERRSEFGFGKAENLETDGHGPLGVKLMQDGIGSLRGAIGTPEQIVGLVERYREAGVDQIIFVSQCGAVKHEHIMESYELFAKEVMPQFRDAEIDADSAAKAERLAPAIEAALARREPPRTLAEPYKFGVQGEPDAPKEEPPRSSKSTARSRSIRKDAFKKVDKFQRAAVARASDAQLERTVGTKLGARMLFKSLEKMYKPSKAGKFRGEIQFTLTTPHGDEVWTVDCQGPRAVARKGTSENPKLRVKAKLVDFLRIGTGNADPAAALIEGRLEVKGDFQAAAKLGEMFGGKSFF